MAAAFDRSTRMIGSHVFSAMIAFWIPAFPCSRFIIAKPPVRRARDARLELARLDHLQRLDYVAAVDLEMIGEMEEIIHFRPP